MSEQVKDLLEKAQPKDLDIVEVAQETLIAFQKAVAKQAQDRILSTDELAKTVAVFTSNLTIHLMRMSLHSDDLKAADFVEHFTGELLQRIAEAGVVAAEFVKQGKHE